MYCSSDVSLCVAVQVSEELMFSRCDLCVGVQVSEELVVKVLFSRCDLCVGVQVCRCVLVYRCRRSWW